MSKRRKKINSGHITGNVEAKKLEIDYDKLAETIVHANEMSQSRNSFALEWMKWLLIPSFYTSSFISLISCVIFGYKLYCSINPGLNFASFGGLIKSLTYFILCLLSLESAFISFFTGKEIANAKNIQLVSTMFSNLVALIALVIAIITFLNGFQL